MAVISSSETSDTISQYTVSYNTWHICEELKSSKLTVAELLNVSSWLTIGSFILSSQHSLALRPMIYKHFLICGILHGETVLYPRPKHVSSTVCDCLGCLMNGGNHLYPKTVSIGGTRKACHTKVTRDIINTLGYRLSCVINDWIFYCVAMEWD
jgi:hypothetical protein